MILLLATIMIVGCKDDHKGEDEKMGEEAQLTGKWSGKIEIPNMPLPIMITFEAGESISATIDIPAQGIESYPFEKVTQEEEKLFLKLSIQGQEMTFDGTTAANEISGSFHQNGQTFPFQLKKDDETVGDEKEGEFLTIQTNHGEITGELALPKGEGPFPVLLIIPGSGPTDRNGNSQGMTNDSLKMVAEELAENGVASLRYDKRGAGKNMKAVIDEEDLTLDDFVQDAINWIDELKTDDRFSRFGVIGHSQGSLVGILAAQQSKVDVFISVAGAGKTLDAVLEGQLEEQLSDKLLEESKTILAQMKQGKQVEQISKELQALFRPSVQPFLMSWMEYDPVVEIAKLQVPILLINGTNDLQVPVEDAKLLQKANEHTQLQIVDDMNHILKIAPTDRQGNLATYTNPSLPLAPEFVKALNAFLAEQLEL